VAMLRPFQRKGRLVSAMASLSPPELCKPTHRSSSAAADHFAETFRGKAIDQQQACQG